MYCKNCEHFKRLEQDEKNNFGICGYLDIAYTIDELTKGGILIIDSYEPNLIFEENFGCNIDKPYKEIRRKHAR